jgi:hypothetical protein
LVDLHIKKIKDEYDEYYVFFESGKFSKPIFIIEDYRLKKLLEKIGYTKKEDL